MLKERLDWDRARDRARSSPAGVSDADLDDLASRIDESPRTYFALLLDIAGRDPQRAPSMLARFRALAETRPADALAAAGYNLHEYGPALLDPDWIRWALDHFDANPEGAWGIATAAAWNKPRLLGAAELDAFESRGRTRPGDCVQTLLLVAGSDPSRAEMLIRRAISHIEQNPAQTMAGASTAARRYKALLRQDLFEIFLRHVDASPEDAWEFLHAAAEEAPQLFTGPARDRLSLQAASKPDSYFAVVRFLKDRTRYLEKFSELPAAAIATGYYWFHSEPESLWQDAVDAVCTHFASEAYKAYDILGLALRHRPELIQQRHIEAAIAHIPLATNWAFGFFSEVLKLRPDFTPLCTLALFEALANEPGHRAFNRPKMIQDIITIAQNSHVMTALERALREPPSTGSRRARALMAILFRQPSRARQYVLFEALRFASVAVTWNERQWTPLWDFFLRVLDESGDDAVSTAAAERFLEGAFQLNHLMDRGVDHDEFRKQFDLRNVPPAPWPAAVSFLQEDAELTRLHSIVTEFARRFQYDWALTPIRDFENRIDKAQTEASAIARQLQSATGKRREHLEIRLERLKRRLARCPVSEPEKRQLAKRVRDSLRAHLAAIAQRSVHGSKMALYRSKVARILGRDIDLEKVDPAIFPSFLFFKALEQFPRNHKYLARLIDDRIEGRAHDWLWTEPEAAAWTERVARAQPGIRFERWRAPFSMEFQYRPNDASQEKKQRIRQDLQRVRDLFASIEVEGVDGADYEKLAAKLQQVKAKPPKKATGPVLEEIAQDLERVRIVQMTPESDYEGKIRLEVETNPFEILYMGEYGFASCLSLNGSGVWSAVSNAIDVDKAVIWAKEGNGNVVGRRLIALTEGGILSYRTYANRHGLSLDAMFESFLRAYAEHCGTRVIHGGRGPGPLLSDRWYDDGSI